MRADCHLGQRKAALEQYERFRKTLLNELGAEPLGETQELYLAILKGRFEVSPPGFRSVTALAVEHTGRDPLDVTSTVRLIGREQETAFLEDCWRTALKGNTRLALISGEVGVGKTRLVEAFANRLRWQECLRFVGTLLRVRALLALPTHRRCSANIPTRTGAGSTGKFSCLGTWRSRPACA